MRGIVLVAVLTGIAPAGARAAAPKPAAVTPTPAVVTPTPAVVAKKKQRYATRSVIGLELAPGVAIPFKKYLAFGSGPDTYEMENGAGFSFSLTLTLDAVEVRWSYASLSTGRVTGRLPDSVYNDIVAAGFTNLNQVIDLDAPSALAMHQITVGYRIRFDPANNFTVAIPIGAGLAIGQPPDFGIVNYSLFGLGAHVGVLAEYRLFDLIAVGGGARFMTYITEPDANLGGAGIAATKSIFDNAVAWLPMLAIDAHVRIYY